MAQHSIANLGGTAMTATAIHNITTIVKHYLILLQVTGSSGSDLDGIYRSIWY